MKLFFLQQSRNPKTLILYFFVLKRIPLCWDSCISTTISLVLLSGTSMARISPKELLVDSSFCGVDVTRTEPLASTVVSFSCSQIVVVTSVMASSIGLRTAGRASNFAIEFVGPCAEWGYEAVESGRDVELSHDWFSTLWLAFSKMSWDWLVSEIIDVSASDWLSSSGFCSLVSLFCETSTSVSSLCDFIAVLSTIFSPFSSIALWLSCSSCFDPTSSLFALSSWLASTSSVLAFSSGLASTSSSVLAFSSGLASISSSSFLSSSSFVLISMPSSSFSYK